MKEDAHKSLRVCLFGRLTLRAEVNGLRLVDSWEFSNNEIFAEALYSRNHRGRVKPNLDLHPNPLYTVHTLISIVYIFVNIKRISLTLNVHY